ncbi:MAG: DUF3696 domain-containing protein [Bacteroidota bacterium]
MIRQFTLQNFKAHQETSLRFGNLTVLTGVNGMGKSSVVQALLLLRQSYQHNQLKKGLQLNKPLCEVGMGGDALYQEASEDVISFSLKTEDETLKWEFESKGSDLNSTFLKVMSPQDISDDFSSLFTENFQYLSAERLSPQESYEKDNYSVEIERQISKTKGRGELIAHFLDFYGKKEKVHPALRYPESEFYDLASQTNYWLRVISPDVNVKVEGYDKNFEIRYQFEVPNGLPTKDFRTENVGFGITYALPVIVAVLSAKEGSLIIIENPEAHIHPSGQSKLMELFTLAAEAGIQILLETHSDHILNGALVAVKQKRITPENVAVHYFARREGSHTAFSEEITISEQGRINYQPDGFFDQTEKDMDLLLGIYDEL